MSKREVHPFYCAKKGCRKSAWATPEHLTPEDWALVDRVIAALEADDQAVFDAAIAGEAARTYFNRIIGWPEGLNYYCGGSEVARQAYFNGFASKREGSELLNLKAALAERVGPLFAVA